MSKNFLSSQPPAARGIISVVLVLGGAYIGWEVYRNYKKKKDLEEANQAAGLAEQELQQLQQQGVRPTYTTSQFEVWTQTLVQAMTGCGTDEDAIMNVFRALRNDADIRKLVSVFGIRYYQPCAWSSPISYAIWQGNDQAYGGGLPTWLGYDLSSGDIDDINQILSSKGINYQF